MEEKAVSSHQDPEPEAGDDCSIVGSEESEFYGIAKAAATGLGVKGLMEDLGDGVEAQVNTDSSAATIITARRGAGGRVRHTEPRDA